MQIAYITVFLNRQSCRLYGMLLSNATAFLLIFWELGSDESIHDHLLIFSDQMQVARVVSARSQAHRFVESRNHNSIDDLNSRLKTAY